MITTEYGDDGRPFTSPCFKGITPKGWNNINTAPRDGTIIEIRNDWGIKPSYRFCQWISDCSGQKRWLDANDHLAGVLDGPHLSWRPARNDSGGGG